MSKNSLQAQYDKMTKTPVNKLIISLGVPTIISMLITNLYNIADTFFVSSLGNSASGATGIMFALMAIIQAFGFMFGHGAGSNISRQLGQKNVEKARIFASTSFFLSILFGALITILGFVFMDPLMRLLGSTETILPYARTYGTYILIASPAMAVSCVMNNILRYEGKAAYAMIGLTSGGILNIFGDMILMFGFDMGIKGAGLSTAVSQYISAAILFMPFMRKQTQSRMALKYFTRQWKDVWNIVAVGMPSLCRQGLNSISVMTLNQCTAPYGDAAIAAMSIVARVMNLLFCVAIGIGQGFQPVSAFNYGAKFYTRVKSAFKFTLKLSVGIMCGMALMGFIFAEPIITIFRNDPDVIRIGAFTLRAHCISLIFVPISVAGNMLFQSIGKSGRAILLACTRSGIFFIPIVIILSRVMGLTGIQISQAAADMMSSAVTVPMVYRFFKSLPKDGIV